MLNYCIVKQRIGAITEDTPDDDDRYPDYTSVFGQVSFKSSMRSGSAYKITDEYGVVHTVPDTRIVAQIINGEIVHEGLPGVPLFAAGPNSNPSNIVYTATYTNLTAAGQPITLDSITFRAVPGGTIDLSDFTPVAGAPVAGIIQGPPGHTPYIGENGNWWINGGDTGVVATSPIIHSYTELRDAFEENTMRVKSLEAMNGVTPESPVDGQTANLISQSDSLTSGALERKIRQDAVGAAGIYGVMSDLPPAEATYRGVPVVWLKTVYNTIPEIQSLSLSMNGMVATAAFEGLDDDGDDLIYQIDWGDGAITQNAESPTSHTYSAEGEYTVKVVVTDQWGASGTGVATIFVAPALPNRWAYDSFSYPDGTILAGWQSDTVKDPAYTTEVGDLTWQPGDQSTGLPTTDQKAHVRDGKFIEGTPQGTVEGSQRGIATLDLPSESYRVQVRYGLILDGQTSALSNVTLYLSCSPVTQRNTTGTTSLAIRLGNSLNMAVSTVSNGAFTNVATKGVVPREGLLTATFNSATGAVQVAIDGGEFWSGTYSGPVYPKIGIDVRSNAYLDDFEVAPL